MKKLITEANVLGTFEIEGIEMRIVARKEIDKREYIRVVAPNGLRMPLDFPHGESMESIIDRTKKFIELLKCLEDKEQTIKNELTNTMFIDLIEESESTPELIKNCAYLSIRTIKITFEPPLKDLEDGEYDMSLFSNELIESLKQPKIASFDVIEDAQAIVSILQSKQFTELEYLTQ